MIRPPARQSSGLFLNIEVYVNISWPATQTKTEYECKGGLESTIIFDIDKSGESEREKKYERRSGGLEPCEAGNANEWMSLSLYKYTHISSPIIQYLISFTFTDDFLAAKSKCPVPAACRNRGMRGIQPSPTGRRSAGHSFGGNARWNAQSLQHKSGRGHQIRL